MNTKFKSYLEIIQTGKVTDQRVKICKLLSHPTYIKKGLTRREIAGLTRYELSSICGRVNELIAVTALEYGDDTTCKITGKTVNTIKIRAVNNE